MLQKPSAKAPSSAELLAQLKLRCRELMRDLSLAKYDRKGRSRPFGGLNVILAGDVYQLPPPKGTFLGDIPWDLLAGRKSTRRAPGHQGQTLLWGSAEAGMQGVTELVRCERTQDAWLAELQTQFRHGQLSEDNHNFLHGKPTAVPGSWIAGHATCKQPGCAALVANGKTPDCIQAAECSQCAADRRSRILVAQGPTDKRFQAEFADAVAIFGTNDIKYHVNKLRALQWAKARGKQPYLFVAQDVASAPVVQEKANLTSEKLGWLQRHDKECGGLYGVLPLCVGMPVRATDHLDRKRGILKGTKGHVVGWSKITNETPAPEGVVCNKLPAVVYVQFQTTTTWQIQGVPDANVYRNSGPAGHGPQFLTLLSEPTRKQLSELSVFQPRRLTNGAFATPKQQGPEGRTGPAGHGPQFLTLLSEPTRKLALWAICLPAAKAHKRRLRHTETAGPWRTDRACGPRPPVPNVAFWTDKKTSSLSCLSSSREGSQTAPSPHRNSRALKDGPGLRA